MNDIIKTHEQLAVELATSGNTKLNDAAKDLFESGRHLIEVKKSLNHGEFMPWIEANMPVSNQQCQNYMNAYEYSKLKPGFNLISIKEASKKYLEHQKSLNPPKEKPQLSATERVRAKAREEAASYKPVDMDEEHQKVIDALSGSNLYEEKTPTDYEEAIQTIASVLYQYDDSEKLIKSILKLMMHEFHPDKGEGNEDFFNRIATAKQIIGETK